MTFLWFIHLCSNKTLVPSIAMHSCPSRHFCRDLRPAPQPSTDFSAVLVNQVNSTILDGNHDICMRPFQFDCDATAMIFRYRRHTRCDKTCVRVTPLCIFIAPHPGHRRGSEMCPAQDFDPHRFIKGTNRGSIHLQNKSTITPFCTEQP